ncbi:MAG TPA: archaeosortase/exosortase family protein [Myxococcota bacterium]|nr:archaeosortase/exosortase family protein [Myxococcota bacterium]
MRAAVYLALVVGLSNLLLADAVDRAALAQLRRSIAWAAAALLGLFQHDVRAVGEHVLVGESVVEIVNGCTGLDVGVFLASAIAVFPAPWRARLRGVALAFAVALAVNFVRVLTLCVLVGRFPIAFDVVHIYVWPVLISLACLGTLVAWIRTAPVADV